VATATIFIVASAAHYTSVPRISGEGIEPRRSVNGKELPVFGNFFPAGWNDPCKHAKCRQSRRRIIPADLVPCDLRAGAPSKVQAGLEDIVGRLDVDRYREARRCDERGRLSAEVVVVVFEES
jgi:hypothetical protein